MYDAFMSCETPRFYKQNIETIIKKKVGKNGLTVLSSSYNIIIKKHIDFKIKINNANILLNVNQDDMGLLFTMEF